MGFELFTVLLLYVFLIILQRCVNNCMNTLSICVNFLSYFKNTFIKYIGMINVIIDLDHIKVYVYIDSISLWCLDGILSLSIYSCKEHLAHIQTNLQWTLTYPDTSVPKLTVLITEFPIYIIIIGSQTCVRISELSW